MTNPDINSFSRSMYQEEIDSFATFNLNENFFDFGIHFVDGDDQPLVIPTEVGIVQYELMTETVNGDSFEAFESVNCTTIFDDRLTDANERTTLATSTGYCLP